MYTYEEIRDVIVDLLLKREKTDYGVAQWENLKLGIGKVLERRKHSDRGSSSGRLNPQEQELARDAFWDLFRQGYITLGADNSNPNWPFFRLSHFGATTLHQNEPYRFTDTRTYLDMVRAQIPDLDDVTAMYLDEAVCAFYAGCHLSSCVMLGVATENRFRLLMQALKASQTHATDFAVVHDERGILRKITKFRNILQQSVKSLPVEVREDLDTNLSAIQSAIRTSRNEAGHPTGKAGNREQVYVLLQLFAPYARKLAQLQAHFSST